VFTEKEYLELISTPVTFYGSDISGISIYNPDIHTTKEQMGPYNLRIYLETVCKSLRIRGVLVHNDNIKIINKIFKKLEFESDKNKNLQLLNNIHIKDINKFYSIIKNNSTNECYDKIEYKNINDNQYIYYNDNFYKNGNLLNKNKCIISTTLSDYLYK